MRGLTFNCAKHHTSQDLTIAVGNTHARLNSATQKLMLAIDASYAATNPDAGAVASLGLLTRTIH